MLAKPNRKYAAGERQRRKLICFSRFRANDRIAAPLPARVKSSIL